jgi:hypothetical protein
MSERTRTGLRTRKPFYVGYFKTPDPTLRFLRVALPAMTLTIIACAVVVAATATPGGSGVWHSARVLEWTGTLRLDPYPRLVLDGDVVDAESASAEPVASAGESLWLVELGKVGGGTPLGGPERGFERLANQRVSVQGYWLERDGRKMIEIDAAGDAVAGLGELDAPANRGRGVVSMGSVVLDGEIVDTKCFLGAMKPGSGVAHAACARLCVAGGIPPVLIVRGGPDAPELGMGSRGESLVLIGADGAQLNHPESPILWSIGLPVRVTGELLNWDGVMTVRVESVERL